MILSATSTGSLSLIGAPVKDAKFNPELIWLISVLTPLSKLQSASIFRWFSCLFVWLDCPNYSTNHSKTCPNVMFGTWRRVDWKACRVKLFNTVKNRLVNARFRLHVSQNVIFKISQAALAWRRSKAVTPPPPFHNPAFTGPPDTAHLSTGPT